MLLEFSKSETIDHCVKIRMIYIEIGQLFFSSPQFPFTLTFSKKIIQR